MYKKSLDVFLKEQKKKFEKELKKEINKDTLFDLDKIEELKYKLSIIEGIEEGTI